MDECVEVPSICNKGTCRNVEGTFECTCYDGYKLSPTLDECIGKSMIRPKIINCFFLVTVQKNRVGRLKHLGGLFLLSKKCVSCMF